MMWNALSRLFIIGLLSTLSCPLVLAAMLDPAEVDRNASALQAQLPNVHERILQIPMDDPSVKLQTTVYTPDGLGPFPLAIMNHGSSGYSDPHKQGRSQLSYATIYFLSRGYAVVQPMMRGFAGSGGKIPAVGCDITAAMVNNALDIQRVINYLGTAPLASVHIDTSQVIVAGQSFGGYNTLAVGTLNIPAVKGLVNFNGGQGFRGCQDKQENVVNAAGYYAARTQAPSLWFYGSNDSLIKEEEWRAAYHRYTLLGGKATLVPFGNFFDDSHNLLGHSESIAIITPPLDAFLKQVGLPSKIKFANYLPMATPDGTPSLNGAAVPSPSHFADLHDLKAVPLGATAEYQRFLTLPKPRVFLIGENNSVSVISGGYNPLQFGLDKCQQNGVKCWPYAIDDQVVWVRPILTPIPPASHFADIKDVSAVPIPDNARSNYQKFLDSPLPRVFMISKNAISATSGGLDPLGAALKACEQKQMQCWPYAVDDQVVWAPTQDFFRPSHFADIHDSEAIPFLTKSGKASYAKFLTLPNPRAFVLAPNGAFGMASGTEALARATSQCQGTQHYPGCTAYALNDDVVWVNH
ncbi:dienelactone hydrolase family protein [Aquirhabdus sp.]|uniref:dienelactone hydrolase family protein n=1 Tax=Aquirhabdus sp. TaxID=2824160 RepID=UPI00396C9E69